MENIIEDRRFEEERALYGSQGIVIQRCKFDGEADGESALKESKDVKAIDCLFNLRYPFWHDDNVEITNCRMTENCRAALWYTNNAVIKDTKIHGIKALRECSNIRIEGCDIISPEFGWMARNVKMKDTTAQSEYFMMRGEKLFFENVELKGKYSFQYTTDSVFEKCNFDTKDAFWHTKNAVIKDSIIKGEYLAWYSENVTFENCTIIGIQPLCYCKGLKLINCKMIDAELAFEKSEVDASIESSVKSIKNPKNGRIVVQGVEEVIMDDEEAKGEVIVI